MSDEIITQEQYNDLARRELEHKAESDEANGEKHKWIDEWYEAFRKAWLEGRGSQPGALFGEDGRGISVRGIQKRVEGLAQQCRIDGLDCHALRHTCGKSMIDAGRPLTEVRQVLGHSKIETTARYVQPGREDLAEAVEAGELGRLRRA